MQDCFSESANYANGARRNGREREPEFHCVNADGIFDMPVKIRNYRELQT